MEKYILPIILSLFVIYLFCFRKKDLIEGVFGAGEGEEEEEEEERELARAGHTAEGAGGAGEAGPEEDVDAALAAGQHTPQGGPDGGPEVPQVPSPEPPPRADPRAPEPRDGGAGTSSAPKPSNRTITQADENKKDLIVQDASNFLKEMAGNPDGREFLSSKGYGVIEEDGEIIITRGDNELRTNKEIMDLYDKFGTNKAGEYISPRTVEGVSEEKQRLVSRALNKIKEGITNHKYIALGLGAISVILFERDDKEDCIEKCTSGDAEWKKDHNVEDEYSDHCPDTDCADFCSASGEGECTTEKRNAASAEHIISEAADMAEGAGEGLLGPIKDLLEGIGLIPIAIVCCIFISIPVILVIFSMITSKVSSVKENIKSSNSFVGETINKADEIYKGGGLKNSIFRLDSPKVITLIFFIFILYNGRR